MTCFVPNLSVMTIADYISFQAKTDNSFGNRRNSGHETKGGGRIVQILYIVVQCPPNGNMSAFYSNIGHEIDRALGHTSPIIQDMIDKKNSLGKKLNIVTNLIEKYNIGLIVFDEIQMFITDDAKGSKVNVKKESFEAITTMMNTTDVSIGVIGTKLAYKMIFKDQIHQHRRLGKRIQADEYCDNNNTFMRIISDLFQYQWTESKLDRRDITPDILQAFKDCTHGIIDQMITLYIAVQHEAVYTCRKSKINGSFIKHVHKKYFGHMDDVYKNINSNDYEKYRSAYFKDFSEAIVQNIEKLRMKSRKRKSVVQTKIYL